MVFVHQVREVSISAGFWRPAVARLHFRCSGPRYWVRSWSSWPKSHGPCGGMGWWQRQQVALPASTSRKTRSRSFWWRVPYPRWVVEARGLRAIGSPSSLASLHCLRMGKIVGVAAAVAVAMTLCVAPASAEPPPAGCERVPIFGLNPQGRELCDGPIQADGSWTRWRQFSSLESVHSTCGADGYMTRTGYYCPPWATYDSVPAEQGPVDTYVVTADTIPAGEPGHIDS